MKPRRKRTRKDKKIVSPLSPPRGAKYTGEVVSYGGVEKHVYRELKPTHQRSEVVVVRDPDTGRVVSHDAPGGKSGLPLRQRVETIPGDSPEAYREFILVDLYNGTVKKEFNFREDPEKLARQKKEAAMAARREAVLDRLVDADEETLKKVLGDGAAEEVKKAGEAAEGEVADQRPAQRFEVRKRDGAIGWYDVWDRVADEAVNEDALRKADAETLVESFVAPPPVEEEEGD
jgi:hypothetical protein